MKTLIQTWQHSRFVRTVAISAICILGLVYLLPVVGNTVDWFNYWYGELLFYHVLFPTWWFVAVTIAICKLPLVKRSVIRYIGLLFALFIVTLFVDIMTFRYTSPIIIHDLAIPTHHPAPPLDPL